MNKILDKLAYGPTLFLGGVFFLMPFFPEPHLVEKIKLIMYSAPMGGKDWADFVLHLFAGSVALLKFVRHRQLRGQGVVGEGDQDAEPAEKQGPGKS